MSALADAAADYLRLRNRLGHDLAEYHRLLPRFVAFLDDAGLPTVTVAAALEWANAPEVDPSTTMAARRMTIARGFARHMAGLDPRTEIPPFGLLASRRRRHEPFIFSPADIDTLLAGARSLRTRFASATHHTLIGLLATTGMRVGEAIRLDRGDVDETDAVLIIRESKFGKSRLVPLQPSVPAALRRYARLRDEVHRDGSTRNGRDDQPLFPTRTGRRLSVDAVERLVRLHATTAARTCPTIQPQQLHPHVLRHSCAMSLLQAGVDTAVIALWLGHADPRSTNIYLHADMTIKQRALDATTPPSAAPGRYQPNDKLLAFLERL
jgi:site-specific recombinase XerD